MRSRVLRPCASSRAVRNFSMLPVFPTRRFGRGIPRIVPNPLIVLIGSCATAPFASASEYGISTYRPGLMDLGAGLLPPPGALMVKNMFMYQAASSRAVTEDGRIEADTKTDTYNDAVFLGYVTPFSFLGARYAVGTIQMVRISAQSAHIGPPSIPTPEQTLTVAGIGDGIFLPVILGWDLRQFHLTASFAFYAPTGNYDPNSIISIGLNRWAFEPDIGLTWMDEGGHEISLFTGYTINTTNPADHYSSGDEFHADFAFVQHFSNGFMFGTAGYAFQQTTADSGPSAVLGSYEGRVIGLGPIGGYTVRLTKWLAVDLYCKYDFEFAAQNRVSGNELWFNAVFHP